jgi:mannose/cellobiose epimerase-like protein (N-acyl-D-glucosamine 2-epimerase family)
LKEEIDFWLCHGVDHEHGGFICGLKHDGERLTTNKFVWFQGRGLWVFSYLFQHANELPFATDNDRSKWMDVAAKTREFVQKYGRDKVRIKCFCSHVLANAIQFYIGPAVDCRDDTNRGHSAASRARLH